MFLSRNCLPQGSPSSHQAPEEICIFLSSTQTHMWSIPVHSCAALRCMAREGPGTTAACFPKLQGQSCISVSSEFCSFQANRIIAFHSVRHYRSYKEIEQLNFNVTCHYYTFMSCKNIWIFYHFGKTIFKMAPEVFILFWNQGSIWD